MVAPLDDLALDLFLVTYLPAAVDLAVIAENNRGNEEQMASLRLYDLGAGCPTNAGTLLFARDPLRWMPGAWVQFVRWAGTTMAHDPIGERRFRGDLITVLREVDAFVSLPAQARPVTESALRERTETDYPPAAVRELLLNAIMHRSYESNAPVRFYWYDDRIEIQNPGGLYGMASPRELPAADGLPQSGPFRGPRDAGLRQRLRARGRPGAGRPAEERQPRGGIHVRSHPGAGDHPEGALKTIAFFNNKGGVGKTTLVYHLAWMYAELGFSVLAADLDPQANLSTVFLDDERLEQLWPDGDHPDSILGAVSPILRGLGDIRAPHVEKVADNLGLVVGDLGLSSFEAKLSSAWPDCLGRDESAFRTESAFHRTILGAGDEQNADLALIDLGPNLGAINRAAIIAANFVVFPLAPDLFSLQALRNVGPTLREWRGDWQDRLARRPAVRDLDLPSADIVPAGYIVMQHAVRAGRPVRAYQKWIARIPDAIAGKARSGRHERRVLDR